MASLRDSGENPHKSSEPNGENNRQFIEAITSLKSKHLKKEQIPQEEEKKKKKKCTLLNCDKVFKTNTGLRLHLKQHSGEFLRNRQLDHVRAARAMGLSNWQIIRRHILPNSMTPVVTFLPFRMSAAILALTSLDFLGLGVPPDTPSLGELLFQGKNNLDAWWISLSTFAVLVFSLLLLTFMGDALRDALDPRKEDAR